MYYQEAQPGCESESVSACVAHGTSFHPESWLTRQVSDPIPQMLTQKISVEAWGTACWYLEGHSEAILTSVQAWGQELSEPW